MLQKCKRGHMRVPENLHPSGHCKICRYAAQKANRWKHIERIALTNKKWALLKYGLTQESYDAMREQQNKCCAICERSENLFKHRLGVDHNHKTGKVRGLLCSHCNGTVLRLVENNPEWIVRAEKYLEVYHENWNDAK